MSRETFRTLLTALIDTALSHGWCLAEVHGELAVAGLELDERTDAICFRDDKDNPLA